MKPAWSMRLGSLGVTLALIALWAAAALGGWVSPVFLPGPVEALHALFDGVSGNGLGELAWATVQRMLYGWALASLLGLGLGAWIGMSPTLRAWLNPTLELLRPLPASALVPVVIAFVGLSPAMVLIVIAFGASWPVLLSTVQGFASIEPRLLEVGRVLGLSRVAFVWKIGLPSAMPDALAGMRLSLTVALILAVIGEMLASQAGLGSAILLAARSFRAPDMYAGVALLGLIGLVSNVLLGLAERSALRWKNH